MRETGRLPFKKRESNMHVKGYDIIFLLLHRLFGTSGGAIPAVYSLKPVLGVFPLQPSGSDKRTRGGQ